MTEAESSPGEGEEGTIPPPGEDSGLPEHGTRQVSLLPWEVGNHCPHLTNGRFCSSSQGCST